MKFADEKFEKMYERYKELALFQHKNFTEEDLSSDYLNSETFKNVTKNEKLAYERGVLRGIRFVDSMLTPIMLDPLESPEARYRIIMKYFVNDEDGYFASENIEEIIEKYPSKTICIGWSIFDVLLKKKPDNVLDFYLYKKGALDAYEKLMKDFYGI